MKITNVAIDLESMDTLSLRALRHAIANVIGKRRFKEKGHKIGDQIFPGGRMARIVEIKDDSVVVESIGDGGFGTYKTREIQYRSLFRI